MDSMSHIISPSLQDDSGSVSLGKFALSSAHCAIQEVKFLLRKELEVVSNSGLLVRFCLDSQKTNTFQNIGTEESLTLECLFTKGTLCKWHATVVVDVSLP
ncbi:hypothetical protein Nepgr_016869 [Nepenthes gracilis]|uniref:Uncharacterized protein n=1 Tax=Nepenthes gracilis TaxID=150966 RepID=A0AAD3XRZ7_NEPGR|nr:hypothetical protein Nepgr_016869 [Nepenthes gracilis]